MKALVSLNNGTRYSFDMSEESFEKMLDSWDTHETISLKKDGYVKAKIMIDHIVSIERVSQ